MEEKQFITDDLQLVQEPIGEVVRPEPKVPEPIVYKDKYGRPLVWHKEMPPTARRPSKPEKKRYKKFLEEMKKSMGKPQLPIDKTSSM